MRSSASDTALNNGAQSPTEKLNVWRLKNGIYFIKTCMSVFAETKTNEEREIYEFLGNEILSQKRERKGDFRNVVMDLHL